MTAKRLEKAAHLVVDGRITEVQTARAFYVDGDSGTYLVTLVTEGPKNYIGSVPSKATCTCEWARAREARKNERELPECSHVLGARAMVKQERDPFAAFDRE